MTRSPLTDAFAHHAWATLRLIDACSELGDEQLGRAVPGTYGSILDTMRHLVESDSWYLFVISEGAHQPIEDAESLALPELRSAMERQGEAWSRLLETEVDPGKVLVRRRDDGSETHAPLGVRLAQVVHHGTDHRSQICTALTSLGIEPPWIDLWDYAQANGLSTEVAPRS
jgi:uncharacterized damage-inducible protein DinB